MEIATVLGPVDAVDLGMTLVHEHLRFGWPGHELDHRVPFDRARGISACVDRLGELREYGVRTIVDPCPIELGRDPEFAAEVSQQSGVNVVIATGLYNEHQGQPYYFRQLPVGAMTDLFVREIDEGIGTTGIRAGIVKAAGGGVPGVAGATHEREGLGEFELRAHEAGGKAAAETGVPVITHNDERRPQGRQQLKILLDAGVAPERIAIGHSDGVGDMRYYFHVLRRGAFLAFDRFGLTTICSDKFRLASLLGLIHSGFGRQLLLSTDSVVCALGELEPMLAEALANEDWHPRRIFEEIVPQLTDAGVSATEVASLLVHNPARLFGADRGGASHE